MADTIREIIIKDFIARLAEITVANGYNSGCGARVLRARKKIDPAELPACVLWPGDEKAESSYGKLKCAMTLRVELIVACTEDNYSVLSEELLGDVKLCLLSREDETVSPPVGWSRSPDYIDSIIYSGGGPGEYPEEGMLTAAVYANFEVVYHAKLETPYEQ